MTHNPNNLDYSNLNKSLQPKRRINSITTDVAKAIGDVFLQSNGFESRKRASTKTDKLNQFSNSIEGASEGGKANFLLTIDYLSSKNLLKADKIRSLRMKELEDGSKTPDEKLGNILDELTKGLSESEKLNLNQNVSKKLLDASKEARNADELGETINNLESQNSDLKNELDALDAVSEVSEKAVLNRRSKYQMVRVGNSIKNINESPLDPVTKARKVLWQANSFALLGTGKRFDWINKLPRKIDVNKEYSEAVDRLKQKMNETSSEKEKVAIRYIMRQVNKAYTDYLNATNISEETRKQNMRDINTAMAA